MTKHSSITTGLALIISLKGSIYRSKLIRYPPIPQKKKIIFCFPSHNAPKFTHLLPMSFFRLYCFFRHLFTFKLQYPLYLWYFLLFLSQFLFYYPSINIFSSKWHQPIYPPPWGGGGIFRYIFTPTSTLGLFLYLAPACSSCSRRWSACWSRWSSSGPGHGSAGSGPQGTRSRRGRRD
jgi:hypothetical protein